MGDASKASGRGGGFNEAGNEKGSEEGSTTSLPCRGKVSPVPAGRRYLAGGKAGP